MLWIHTAKCLQEERNATVEVMFIVSSEVKSELDKRGGTKTFFYDVLAEMNSLYARSTLT